MANPRVIKTQSQRTPAKGDWTETKKLAEEINSLSRDIEKALDEIAVKYKVMSDKSLQAFKAAPLTDCGFGVSPLAGGRLFHALKMHLMKKDLRIDGSYFGDSDKLLKFTDTIKEATAWLLKFS